MCQPICCFVCLCVCSDVMLYTELSDVSWTFHPSEPLFTALPRFPLFFPTRPCFQHGCRRISPRIAVYVAEENVWTRPVAHRGVESTDSVNCRLMSTLKCLFASTTQNIFSLKPKTIRNLTRNGVFQGPRKMNNSNICRIAHGWRIGVGAVIASTNHRVWISNGPCLAWNILLSYMFPVCGHREAFPALVHGGRTGGIVGNFRRGG